jgi:glycosyltransferase involved in cell wall biosynthesis
MVFPGLLDNRFGDARRVLAETEALADAGHDITLICGSLPEVKNPSVRYWIVPMVEKKYSVSFYDEFRRAFNLIFTTSVNIIARVLSGDFDVVHIQHNHPIPMIATLVAARFNRARCIYDVHDLLPETAMAIRKRQPRGLIYWLLRVFESLLLALSDTVISTSHTAAKILHSRSLGKEITIVHNPMKESDISSLWSPKTDRIFRIAYLGELQQGIRGLEMLVESFAKVSRKSSQPLELVLIGDGDARKELNELAKANGMGDKVIFTGFLRHKEALQMLSQCDIAVLPYGKTPATEAVIPTKLIEYMAVGMPLIVTDNKQFRFVVGPKGLYFNPEIPNSLAEIISRATESQSTLEEIGKAMRERVTPFLWSVSKTRLIEVYSSFTTRIVTPRKNVEEEQN